ncbi:MAG: lysophospholipid acyltransferase family protein [Aristaeellaceae bacterium]
MKEKRSRNAGFSMTSLHGLYDYLYCMLASSILVALPIFGGALYMCGQVAAVYLTTYAGQAGSLLPKAARRWQTALLVLLLVISLCVVVLYPIAIDSPRMWMVFALVLLMMLRGEACRRLIRMNQTGRLPARRMALWLAVVQLTMLAVMAASFLYNLGGTEAWQMLAGYALCSAMECYGMLKDSAALRPMPPLEAEQARQMGETLRGANAYQTYETLSTLILAALVMTLMVMHTFLAVTAEQLLRRMILAVATMLISREAAETLLRWREKRRRADPTNLLLIGLFLWLYALILFARTLGGEEVRMVSVYVFLAMCSAGGGLCLACLARMEDAMVQVAQFTAGGETAGYGPLRAAQQRLATLLGEMLALAALTVLCFIGGQKLPPDARQLAASFQPIMVLPALLTVLAALLSVLRFPLTNRWLDKLARFLRLKEEGGDNPALEKQLHSVVVKPHRQPFGTRMIMAVLRPLFRHELKGAENIVPDVNNPIVFLCNHGEIYGPVASMLCMPVPVRPWVISEMAISKEEVSAYVYKYTLGPATWLGPLRWPIARLLGPISIWGMNQLECIPVFRNKPRELMTTFRTSVEALQAGDNILIFPENPDADRDHPGYEHGGMGELYRGFVMLAQVYYNRTGKRCRFLPMYAHKGLRTLSFGTEIVYDPDNDPMAERDRVVEEAYGQMTALAEREEALYQAQHSAGKHNLTP